MATGVKSSWRLPANGVVIFLCALAAPGCSALSVSPGVRGASLQESPGDCRQFVLKPAPLDERALAAKLPPQALPRRAASLRLVQEARTYLTVQQYPEALSRLEKSMALDSTNPFVYYYLGATHFCLAQHRESLNFLDVAEAQLAHERDWLADIHALKGENFRALGDLRQAVSQYERSLGHNPRQAAALQGLNVLGHIRTLR